MRKKEATSRKSPCRLNDRISELQAVLDSCEEHFELLEQQKALKRVLQNFLRRPGQEVITLFENIRRKSGFSVMITVLATDWAGMINAVAGIVHQRAGNIPFIKGFSLNYQGKELGIVQCYLKFGTREELGDFMAIKQQLTASIKASSAALKGKVLLLEDETIKLEIFNRIINYIKKNHQGKEIDEIISENGEALKFIASRSREYLEDRKIEDLAEIILDNFSFQIEVRNKKTPICIKIKNLKTKFEHLTGITFCCQLQNFSIEHFLKTLEFLVPNHIIKHHKSFITFDNLLVYRIEIVDSQNEPLDPSLIKLVENTLHKIIRASIKETLVNLRNFGGFEHIARALLPYLMDQLNQTNLPHTFFNVEKLDEFVLQLKIITLHFKKRKNSLLALIQELEKISGIEVYSAIPPRTYKRVIQVNLISVKINISEFSGISEIFRTIKGALLKVLGNFRDFNEGMRENDMTNFQKLTGDFTTANPELIKKIYYSLDEIYRVSTPSEVIAHIIEIVIRNMQAASQKKLKTVIVNYRNILVPNYEKTLIVISAIWEKNLQLKLFSKLKAFDFYFTKIEWEHRNYLFLALKRENRPLEESETLDFIKKNFSQQQRNVHIERA